MRTFKMASPLANTSKTRKSIALFLTGFLLLALAASSEVTAAGVVKAYGTLTSIEDDGTVFFIDKVGYFVSPLITVRNARDESIPLSDIKPPQRVYIEYEISSKGFMIIFLREISG
jgi:hypothetical protein